MTGEVSLLGTVGQHLSEMPHVTLEICSIVLAVWYTFFCFTYF